jgi:vancomycin resistance protein YoaR
LPRDARGLGVVVVPVFCVLLTALAWAYQTRPYQDQLSQYTTSLAERSPAQRQNIEAAARRLDGAVIGPGERCSFNALVGPRTIERGFTEANAFMEGGLTRSLGGGVCQASSTLYAALQLTTLKVVQRVAHGAVVSSIPPGRDATVWYGKADLVWENTFDRPIKLRVSADPLALKVQLWGTARPHQRAALRFSYRYGHQQRDRMVLVWRRLEDRMVLLSQDVYRVR